MDGSPKCGALTSTGKKCKMSRPCRYHGAQSPKSSTKISTFEDALGIFSPKTPKKSPERSAKSRSVKTTSPKRSPKTSSPKLDVARFEALPGVVLYQVLLNIPRDQINAICRAASKNSSVYKICKSIRFRQEYDAKHPVRANILPSGMKIDRLSLDRLDLKNSKGDIVHIWSGRRIFIKTSKTTIFVDLHAHLISIELKDENLLPQFLNSIGKSQWLHQIIGKGETMKLMLEDVFRWFFSGLVYDEILQDIYNEIEKSFDVIINRRDPRNPTFKKR